MTAILIHEADAVYKCANSSQVRRYRFKHPDFSAFCIALRRHERELKEVADDEFWKEVLRHLKTYRFRLSAAPLPFNHPAAFSQSAHSRLLGQLKIHGVYSYPSLAETTLKLMDAMTALSLSGENPLLKAIEEIDAVSDANEIGVLVAESYLIRPVEAVLTDAGRTKLHVVSAAQVSGAACLQHLIVVGPSRWFPESVFTAPRASKIDIVQYSWIQDTWKPSKTFLDTDTVVAREVRQSAFENTRIEGDDYIEAGELLPSLDIDRILKGLSTSSSGDTEQEEADANLVLLAGGNAVFLEAADRAKAMVIDFTDADSRIKRILASQIQPGVFLLLRTSGGGDYVRPLADRLLGSQAKVARECQQSWKMRLRQKVREEGALAIAIKLLDLGSKIANETNVRNWMSDRSIRTSEFDDFASIMKLIGLGERAKEYWGVMRAIDIAHLKAGAHIRKLLLR